MTDKNTPQDWPGPDELQMPTASRPVPYTGIAGFTTAAEVRAVAADAYTISGFGTLPRGGRRLAIGVLASWKTLNGGSPSLFPERYPAVGKIREIFAAAAEPYHHYSPALGQTASDGTVFDLKSRCLRLIHYASKEPNLLAQLDRLCEIAGPHLDGFQLNMVWPPAEDMASWRADHPDMRIVLQVNGQMFSNVARTPQLLVLEIGKKYPPGSFTDILFDMSGGAGKPADLTEAKTVIDALYGAFGSRVGIGLAGGLDWHSVWDLKPFFEKWPDLSIDAEGRIRDVFYEEKRDGNWKVVSKRQIADVLGEAAREYARRAFGVMPLRQTPET